MVLGTLLDVLTRASQRIGKPSTSIRNFSVAYGSIGTTLALAGRADESIEYTNMAMRLNPRDPSLFFRYTTLSLAHFVQIGVR